MKQFRNKRKIISLTLVTIAYALIVTPLIITNFEKQHALRNGQVEAAQTSRADAFSTNTTQLTSDSECIPDGSVGIGVLYTNADSIPVTVTVTDQQSNHSVVLGQIMPNETKIGTILTRKFAIDKGAVIFSITSTNTNQTLQKATSYLNISCN